MITHKYVNTAENNASGAGAHLDFAKSLHPTEINELLSSIEKQKKMNDAK